MDGKNYFTIMGRLPGLNDVINACRSHWSNGARLKRQTETDIIWQIKAATGRGVLHPVTGPVTIEFEWHESNKRRDLDNIYSAKKFVLDAMQQAGIIANDNRKHVVGLRDDIVDDKQDFVVVTIHPAS